LPKIQQIDEPKKWDCNPLRRWASKWFFLF